VTENAPGVVVGERYELVERLGEGGMAEVWRATQLNLGRDVALKLVRDHIAGDPQAGRRLEREARVAASLRHPNVVKVHDYGATGERLFLAMELLEGRPLRAVVDAHLAPLPLGRALAIAGQVADALVAAHALGLVHRDLKPENVFLEKTPAGDDRAVVVDFGLAFIAGDAVRGRMTQQGRAIGTPDYMSPEQCTGDALGPPSDVYSFGCMLYEMLTSAPPFAGRKESPAYLHLLEPVRPPREARPDLSIPNELDDLVVRMLAKAPEERPDMEAVRVGLCRVEDPAGAGRGRVRGLPRVERMIAPSAATREAPTVIRPDGVELAVVGALEGELVLSLGANALVPFIVSDDEPIGEARAIYAPGASVEALVALRSEHPGRPLITDADPTDMDRVAALVKVGVDEVVHRPPTASDIAKKVWRALRRAERRRGP